MKTISITSVKTNKNTVHIHYDVGTKLQSYFTKVRVMEIEYSDDISNIHESILIIPFICNVLPIIWLTDAVLSVTQLDGEFFKGLPYVKEGYKNMSPMLEFKGTVQVEQLIDNAYESSDKVAALFSGGVDAFATLIAHAAEKPRLVTLWGADVKLTDTDGWTKIAHHTQDTSNRFGLPTPLLIRSNFRMMLNEGTLGQLVAASGDGWWHGYQHGIALLGHAAPVAKLERWKTLYIASSFTPDNKVICASDPTIDNKLRLISTRVWHDQYEANRQQKVGNIVHFCKTFGQEVQLRVCWISSGGRNCCECEKCRRTIFSLLAEGANPLDYNFIAWRKGISQSKALTIKHCRYTPRRRKVYAQIQARFHQTLAYKNDPTINWFYKVNFYQSPTLVDWLGDKYTAVRRILGKIKRRMLHFLYG